MSKLREKYGPNWGLDSGGVKRQPTMAEARPDLIAQIGQDAFDAMPEAGYDWKKLVPPKVGGAAQ